MGKSFNNIGDLMNHIQKSQLVEVEKKLSQLSVFDG